jgi:hypothetical protein
METPPERAQEAFPARWCKGQDEPPMQVAAFWGVQTSRPV